MPLRKFDFFLQSEQKVLLFLANQLALQPHLVQRFFDTNRVFVNDAICNDKTVRSCGKVSVLLFEPKPLFRQPIFTTKQFMVFDKEAHVYIHPQVMYDGYTLLDEIRHYGGKSANPCHRLDRETSGLVICGISKNATVAFKNMFEARSVQKEYLAIVKGCVKNAMTIEEPLARTYAFDVSKHKVKVCPNGKKSITHVFPLRYDAKDDTTLVKLIPVTGRTHQLRVHMFHVKHPIVGDPIYGASYEFANDYLNKKITERDRVKFLGSKRLMLHSNMLAFEYEQRKYKIVSQCSTWNIGTD
jgi:23S rRNA pseudouridine1911/1915/1917 synthase